MAGLSLGWKGFLLHPVETLFLSTCLLALIIQHCEEPVFMFWKSCPCVWKGSWHLPKAERGRLLLQELSLPKYVTLHLFCLTLGGNYKPSPPIVCLGPFKCPFCCQISLFSVVWYRDWRVHHIVSSVMCSEDGTYKRSRGRLLQHSTCYCPPWIAQLLINFNQINFLPT